MTKPLPGIRATGHPVTSAGAAAISMRLVHRPSTTKTVPVDAHAVSTADQENRHIVAAPVGEDVDALLVADHDDRDVAERPSGGLPGSEPGQLGGGHEVVPAGFDQVRDRLGLVSPGGLAEREVPAEEPASGHRGQPDQSQAPGGTVGSRKGRRVQGDGSRVGERVHDADPHLLLVQFGPVGRAGEGGGQRGGQPRQDEPP